MNRRLFTVYLLLSACCAEAGSPLKDYRFVRGACYIAWSKNDSVTIEREMSYTQQLNLNSTRIWLDDKPYQRIPTARIEKRRIYIRIAKSKGLTTMPILFDGNFLDPATLKPAFRDTIGNRYVKEVVSALKHEEGLLLWNIMNEPGCNDYYLEAPAAEKQKRWKEISDFVTYYCRKVREIDAKGTITVGHTLQLDVKMAVELLDVIFGHDYQETRQWIQKQLYHCTCICSKIR